MTIRACALIMKRRFEQWWWTIPPISRTKVRTSNLTIFDKTSGRQVLILIFSESTLIVLFWIEWLQFLFTFTNNLFLFNIQSNMIEEILYLQNMCLFSNQHHNVHVDTVRSRCYIPLHLNNDIYSCTLYQRYLDHTL
jgi:hypothetical protein